ncbi:hypothetical protein E6Q11_01915 [Candidatus Dojkabacteria bacterium]|uniref:Uncharacterized protein n=1 Tax=Candidatus Dojkabacteria bacterium TaxID=2099670 RepID=A0A5C7J8S9_9BACT|nr:MAG: hypothetical protein E6Q11_01915 [Candidatus Dojkabacteria bacterium]
MINGLYEQGWLCRPGSEDFAKLDFSLMSTFAKAKETGGFRNEPNRKDASEPIPYPLKSEWFAKRLPSDLRLVWPIYYFDDLKSLRYPLNQHAGYPGIYYELELQITAEYMHRCSEIIDPLSSVDCQCGEKLLHYPENEPFFEGRIYRNCPKCGVFFDPGKFVSTCRDAWTRQENQVPGGATSCFALVVDCGKSLPKLEAETVIEIHHDLKQLVEDSLSVKCYEQYDIY